MCDHSGFRFVKPNISGCCKVTVLITPLLPIPRAPTPPKFYLSQRPFGAGLEPSSLVPFFCRTLLRRLRLGLPRPHLGAERVLGCLRLPRDGTRSIEEHQCRVLGLPGEMFGGGRYRYILCRCTRARSHVGRAIRFRSVWKPTVVLGVGDFHGPPHQMASKYHRKANERKTTNNSFLVGVQFIFCGTSLRRMVVSGGDCSTRTGRTF